MFALVNWVELARSADHGPMTIRMAIRNWPTLWKRDETRVDLTRGIKGAPPGGARPYTAPRLRAQKR
jgi:hypothetical protein